MAIPASHVCSVTTRILSGGSADLETNGLLLTKSAVLQAQAPAMVFTSYSDVSKMFGAQSDETAFAVQYFSGVNNQQTSVKKLVIARRIASSASAWVRGGVLTNDLAYFKTVTDGSLKLTVDGTATTKTNIDFSAATSLSDVGTIIATAFANTVSVTYSSNLEAFTITSSTAGASSSVVVGETTGGTSLADAMKLTADDGAVSSDGANAMTVAENMDAICAVTRNWVGYTTVYETDLAEAKELCAWADLEDDYFYCDWTLDENCLSVLTQLTTKPYQLQDLYNCAAFIYGNFLDAAFVLACGASIAWDRIQGMKVWFAKNASGLTARVSDESAANALENMRVSYFGDFATRNAEFKFFNRGTLCSSLYGFIDVLYGSIWLRNKIQRACMDGFAANNRVPYNARGATLIASWIQDPINAAKRNGVIDVGLELSEAQKAQIINETDDPSVIDKLLVNGLYFQITMPDANVRADRGSPIVTLYFCYAGSVQKLDIGVTEVL